jgi:hypothetical protein
MIILWMDENNDALFGVFIWMDDNIGVVIWLDDNIDNTIYMDYNIGFITWLDDNADASTSLMITLILSVS